MVEEEMVIEEERSVLSTDLIARNLSDVKLTASKHSHYIYRRWIVVCVCEAEP